MPVTREVERGGDPKKRSWEALRDRAGTRAVAPGARARKYASSSSMSRSGSSGWWGADDQPPTRVEFLLVAMPRGDARRRDREHPILPDSRCFASSFSGGCSL